MRVALPQLPAAAPTTGHGSYNGTLLDAFFQQQDHTAVVLDPNPLGAVTVPPPHEHLAYRRSRFPRWIPLALDPALEVTAARLAARAHVDVVLGNAQWPLPALPRLPRVCILYESELVNTHPWGTYEGHYIRAGAIYLRRNLRGATRVVAISQYAKDTAVRDLGVRPEIIDVAPPALRPFPICDCCPGMPTAPYVAMVGWFHPRKDLPLGLKAWREAQEAGLGHDLVLIGAEGGPDRVNGSVARRILELAGPWRRNVHLTGEVTRGHLGHLLTGASAFFATSLHEGFGIPVIEALACGTPVVVVNRASLPEAAGGHGEVVAPTVYGVAAGLLKVTRKAPDPEPGLRYAQSFTTQRQMAGIWRALDRIEGMRRA